MATTDTVKPAWEPAYPEFAETEKAKGRSAALEDPDGHRDGAERPVEWVRAPGTSHLWGFRLFAASEHRWLKLLFGGKSLLYVRFNPGGRQAGYTEYAYEFESEADARRVFDRMRAAAQPGKVVHSDLIGGRVPYYPTHK